MSHRLHGRTSQGVDAAAPIAGCSSIADRRFQTRILVSGVRAHTIVPVFPKVKKCCTKRKNGKLSGLVFKCISMFFCTMLCVEFCFLSTN